MAGSSEPARPEYTEEEWASIGDPNPLAELADEQLALLHRHWMWANLQRQRFDECLRTGVGRSDSIGTDMADERLAAMYLWYGLLWALIEGLQDRDIELRAAMSEDVDALAPALRRGRNATFHVPREYMDGRLFEVMSDPTSAVRIRRLTSGLGRLLLEEVRRRGKG